jgi:membrane protease YdiL (CAAX protease family)
VTIEKNTSPISPTVDRAGRPAVVLVLWVVLLGLFAGVAPVAQATFAVPFEVLSLVMLAPALACVVVLLRPKWMPGAWKTAVSEDVLTSALVAVVSVVGFVGVLSLLAGRWPSWPPSTDGAPLMVFLVLQTVGALSEEIGWRGVVQRCGEQFAKPAVVSAIAGFLFGATHLGYWSLGVLPVLTFALTAMLMSLTITAIFVGSFWQRMIPAVIIHLGVNLGMTSLSVSDQPLATTWMALVAAMAMLLLATVAGKIKPRPDEPVGVNCGA